MQLDDQTRADLEGKLALLRAARQALSTTPAAEIPDRLSHVLALRALDADIASYEAALAR